MSNINWKNILVIALVATVAAIFLVPLVKPLVQKIPFLGQFAA